jgi:hypothetical protein
MPQWYGTQYTGASDGAAWTLYKIDESAVSDEERARMNVPTLSETREKLKIFNQ